jgi:uncharacterized membrane protein YebE (DUF533 family)
MFDAKKILDQLLGSQVGGALGGSARGGAVKGKAEQMLDLARNNPMKAGALAMAILGSKTGRKMAGSLTKVGGLAAIAGLGYMAYKNYQSGQAPQTVPAAQPELIEPPVDSPFHPQSPALTNDFALKLVQAMIAAANADGKIDGDERQLILERIRVSDVDHEAETFLEKELSNPISIDELVRSARSEEQKVEIYTASRLTLDGATRAERGYLDLLAGRLGLDDALVEHIEATVSAAKV